MEESFSDQPIKSGLKICDNIRKIATYHYFEKHYKLTATDLSKQQELHADPKAIQQTNFTGIPTRAEGATMFFFSEEAKKKKNSFRFFKRNGYSIMILFRFDLILA